MYCLHMKLVLLVLCSDSNISIMMSDKTAIRAVAIGQGRPNRNVV